MMPVEAIQGLMKIPELPVKEMQDYALQYPLVKRFEAADAGYKREYSAKGYSYAFSLQLNMSRQPYHWVAMGVIRMSSDQNGWWPMKIWADEFKKLIFVKLNLLLADVGQGEIWAKEGEIALKLGKDISSAESEKMALVIPGHKIFIPGLA